MQKQEILAELKELLRSIDSHADCPTCERARREDAIYAAGWGYEATTCPNEQIATLIKKLEQE